MNTSDDPAYRLLVRDMRAITMGKLAAAITKEPPIVTRSICGQCGKPDTGVHTCSPQHTLHLTLPTPPSANRWWRRAGTHMHLSTEARHYKAAVASLYAHMQPLDGDLWVWLSWYREAKRGDLDKRIGIILDALQGVAYRTDAQVQRLTAERFEDKAHPRVEVTVTRFIPGA